VFHHIQPISLNGAPDLESNVMPLEVGLHYDVHRFWGPYQRLAPGSAPTTTGERTQPPR
jgi:hypothetical protein